VSDYELAPLESFGKSAYLELMQRVWGERAMSEAEYEWWFERSPIAPPVVSLAHKDGYLVGTAAHSYCRYLLGGTEQLVSYSLHAAVAAEARGRSLFARLERLNEEHSSALGASACLSFPNKASTRILIERLGFKRLPPPRLWVRLLSPGGPLRLIARRPPRVPELTPPSEEAHVYGGVTVVPLTRFGAVTDAIYRAARSSLPDHVVREADYLNWRYIDSPRGYRAFASIRDGAVNGYAVVRAKQHGGLALCVLADLFVAGRGFAETRALTHRCLKEVSHADAAVVLLPGDPAHKRALLSLGFAPSPSSLSFVGLPLASETVLPEERSRWQLSLGDTDFF